MDQKRLLSLTRQAIDKYRMIENGDKIAIGVSGGKDSLTLLYALAKLRSFYDKSFDILAVTVDVGFEEFDYSVIKSYCDSLNVESICIRTNIYDIVFNGNGNNHCYLCSKMRKGALNDAIIEHGCNKVAYAHHKNDVVETLLMSLIYEGRFSVFCPVTYFEDNNISIIRPLIYVEESDVIGFINKYSITPVSKVCPDDGYTKREYIKQLLKLINKDNPGVINRIFTAICNSSLEGWK